jgi:hypothetical protein
MCAGLRKRDSVALKLASGVAIARGDMRRAACHKTGGRPAAAEFLDHRRRALS